MEQREGRDEAGAGRIPHVIHILPRDDAQAASIVRPWLERTDRTSGTPQALIIAPDRDSVFAFAAAVNLDAAWLVPITASRRGERRLQRGAPALCATAQDLMDFMSRSLLKLQGLRSVAIVWADDQMTDDVRSALESVLAEIPRDAERTLLVANVSERVEQFATGFLWRARRIQHETPAAALGAPVEYVTCVPEARSHVMRLLLEQFDPATTALVAFSDEGERHARALCAALGYDDSLSEECRVVRDVVEGTPDLALIVDIPSDLRALVRATPSASRSIALVPPDRVTAVAAALGYRGIPIVPTQALRDAYTARDALRDEIVGTMRGRPLTGEVLALEPIAAEREPILVAAALWRLLEAERSRNRKPTSPHSPAAPPLTAARTDFTQQAAPRGRGGTVRHPEQSFTRLFFSVGERDGVQRGDLVGAIAGEAGIASTQIGKIDLRDTHALVEVAADVAEQVVARLTGASLRGRIVTARVDGGRPTRDRPPGRGGARPPRSGTGPRHATRGDRGGPGRDRSARPRGDEGGRTPRAMRESEEWANRGDRLRHSRRRRDHDS
ncbi:MAG: ATP-dependent RNA helicase DeaD [Gemmatimonadaceae bacterium]|nr:ATP-dependent RNA helicase DeaD [Gemmatimonadaceae bacterium]